MADAQNCLLPMGITSENVAHRFGVTRLEQDQAAVSFTCICEITLFQVLIVTDVWVILFSG